MTPDTRFDTTFCRPKPMPTPTAPENTASPVRSSPMARSPITTASVNRVICSSLATSTRIVGDRSALSASLRVTIAVISRAPAISAVITASA